MILCLPLAAINWLGGKTAERLIRRIDRLDDAGAQKIAKQSRLIAISAFFIFAVLPEALRHILALEDQMRMACLGCSLPECAYFMGYTSRARAIREALERVSMPSLGIRTSDDR